MGDVIVNYELPENVTVNISKSGDPVVNITAPSPIIVNLCDEQGQCPTDYEKLTGKPQINNIELSGNKTAEDLGLVKSEAGKGLSDLNFTALLKRAYDSAVTWIADNSKALIDHIGDSVIHLTKAEKQEGALATGNSELKTVKEVADKSQFAPSENGTILYHTAKWFTPTGTISTVGATATSTSAQFTSAMVGAKLTISGEERIIASFVSAVQVTVNKAYLQDRINVTEWGVYNKASEVLSIGDIRFYSNNIATPRFIIEKNTGAIICYGSIDSYQQRISYQNALVHLFSSTSQSWEIKDLGFRRQAPRVLEIFDGVTNGNFSDIAVRNVAYSGALNFTSDARLKTNVRPVSDALKKCCDIASTIRHFEYKDQDGYFKGMRTSPIAQLLTEKGLGGFVSYRDPKDETEGTLVGWTYKDETYEEKNEETGEIEIKTRRVPSHVGDRVMQVDNNFTPYALLGIAELAKGNEALKTRLENLEKHLGINY